MHQLCLLRPSSGLGYRMLQVGLLQPHVMLCPGYQCSKEVLNANTAILTTGSHSPAAAHHAHIQMLGYSRHRSNLRAASTELRDLLACGAEPINDNMLL
jgi:hypothetical protein